MRILFFLVTFLLLSGISPAEDLKVYDRDWNLKYRIEDGRIYDRDWETKGRIQEDGVYDENWRLKYRIEGDRVYDRDWNLKDGAVTVYPYFTALPKRSQLELEYRAA